MKYDVIVVGAGPGGIFAAYELVKQNETLKIGVFEAGHAFGPGPSACLLRPFLCPGGNGAAHHCDRR